MDDPRRRRRSQPGGTLALLDLIEEHKGAIEYDWRTRFQKPAKIIGTEKMTYGEAWRLVHILAGDPSSQIATALGAWSHPVTREDIVLRDLFDLQQAVAMAGSKKKPTPYPRPWPTKVSKGLAPGADITQDQILDALRAAGHDGALPASMN